MTLSYINTIEIAEILKECQKEKFIIIKDNYKAVEVVHRKVNLKMLDRMLRDKNVF